MSLRYFKTSARIESRGLSVVIVPACDLSLVVRSMMSRSIDGFDIMAEIDDQNLSAFIESGSTQVSRESSPMPDNFPEE